MEFEFHHILESKKIYPEKRRSVMVRRTLVQRIPRSADSKAGVRANLEIRRTILPVIQKLLPTLWPESSTTGLTYLFLAQNFVGRFHGHAHLHV